MSTAVIEAPLQNAPPLFTRKVWTRAECDLLASLEPFQSQSLELIEGELINRMGKGTLHSVVVAMLQAQLARIFGFDFLMPEAAIDVSPEDNPTSEPEPDIVVVAEEASAYAYRRPGPGDIRLLAEVADSSLALDLSIKAGLYARAGIAEYWVADARKRRIVVHRDPAGGTYRNIVTYSASAELTPLAAPSARLRAGDAFPAASDK